jgi:DNA invertase Pin-like site-specific DNA recombinase
VSSHTTTPLAPAEPGPGSAPEPPGRPIRSPKVLPRHLDRTAIVYVRQSTPTQVLEHAESKARQYALAGHAVALGWPSARVVVIDEDQGKSGRGAEHRPGFQRLLAEVTLGHVGLVLGLEMSRLARSSKDWHHLLELCALFGTLLGDQDGVYNPTDSNDRLLLGLKGTMSEFELFTMRNRLQRGLIHKAERGELHIAPPLGYEKSPSGEVGLDRDEQVRGVIRLIFDKFDELGTARQVLVYLVRNDIRLGFRWNRGPRRGQLDWRVPRYGTVLRVLTHPTYAGAYVFGRKDPRRGRPATGAAGADRSRFRATAWAVLLKDRLPAYISWARYEANQERLRGNRAVAGSPGVPRDGGALLAGLAVCGSCGRRLTPHYPRRGRPYYWCTRHLQDIRDQTCHGLTAGVVDRLVEERVLEALKPAGLRLSLRAIADGRAERERLEGHWERELERARYEAERAGRQYQAVEPENRLVARTLEQRWEAALAEVRRLEEAVARVARDRPARLTEAERSRILALSADIPALWGAASTTNADRKEVIRCLVDRVVVHVRQNTEYCDVTIHWKGGCASEHEVIRPVRSRGQQRDGDRLRARVVELHGQGRTAAAIAATLAAEGFSPPRRRGDYNAQQVWRLLHQYGLTAKRDPGTLSTDEWWLPDLARALGVSRRKLREWATRKWCHARQPAAPGPWIVWANRRELDRLRQLKRHSRLGQHDYPPRLTTPTRHPT